MDIVTKELLRELAIEEESEEILRQLDYDMYYYYIEDAVWWWYESNEEELPSIIFNQPR